MALQLQLRTVSGLRGRADRIAKAAFRGTGRGAVVEGFVPGWAVPQVPQWLGREGV